MHEDMRHLKNGLEIVTKIPIFNHENQPHKIQKSKSVSVKDFPLL